MATDRWIVVNDDGSLTLRIENDGWSYMRRGTEAVEHPITFDELVQEYPHQLRHVAERALALLKRLESENHNLKGQLAHYKIAERL